MFYAKHVDERTEASIAAEFGVDASTVNKRCTRIANHLRRAIGGPSRNDVRGRSSRPGFGPIRTW